MKKIALILTFFVAVLQQLGQAQQLPQFSQFLLNDYVFNPAVGGSNDYFDVKLSSRYQWVGVNDAPRTFVASFNGPLKSQKVGLGGYMFADVTGPTRRTGFSFSYAYHFKVSDKLKLSLGVNGGLLQFSIDGSKLNFKDQADIALSSNMQNVIAPDAGAGLHLYSDNFFFSFSVPQILGNRLQFFDDYAQTVSRLSRHYFASTGYTFRVGDFGIQPAILVKYIDPMLQVEGTLRLLYKDLLWIGANYRTEDAVAAMVGYTFLDNYTLAYSYDFPINDFNRLNVASHELIVGFKFVKP